MKDLLVKLGAVDITDNLIEENRSNMDIIFDEYREDQLLKFKDKYTLSNKTRLKIIEGLKNSKVYRWYFSLDPIRDGTINPVNVIKLLKEEVLYQSIGNDESNVSLINGLCNMLYNFIVLRLNPDCVEEMVKNTFDLQDDIAAIISDFYRQNYVSIQMNFIIDRLSSIQ